MFNDLLTLNPIVSIDATGSVVRKVTYNDKSYCGPIFLYQVVTHIGSLIVPVCQMLSERHDTTTIEYWLKNWISSKAHEPLEIVTDMSKALQNAICMAYNHDTYTEYLSKCYKVLIGESKYVSRPYLRIDIAHLIHWVSRLKCFKNSKYYIKDFYLRAIGFMSTLESFEDIEKTMKVLINISSNETGCKDDIEWILKKIQTFKFDDTTINYSEVKLSTTCEDKSSCEKHLSCHDDRKVIDEPENKIQTNKDLRNYIEDLFKKAPRSTPDVSIRFDDVNMYYLPEITKDLKLLFRKFPSWTNAMLRYYESKNYVATSSRSENYFRSVKDNVLTDRQTNRADVFIAEHTKSINIRMIEAKSTYNDEKLTKKKPDPGKSKKRADPCVLNLVENWKNRVIVDDPSEVHFTEFEQSKDDLKRSSQSDPDDIDENTDSIQEVITKDDIINSTLNSTPKNSNTCQNFNKNSDCAYSIVDDLNSPLFHSTPTKINISNNTPSNLSITKNADSSYSVILDEKPVNFQLVQKKGSNKRKISSSVIPDQAKKRGRYLTACPEVRELHQNAADKETNKKKKKKTAFDN